MNFHLRVDESNSTHVHLTVFANGANCGHLTMRPQEYSAFMQGLVNGCAGLFSIKAECADPKQCQDDFYEPDRDESGRIIESTETKTRHCAELKKALTARQSQHQRER